MNTKSDVVNSAPVLGKVSTIYKCERSEEPATKPGRETKFLATSEFYIGFKECLDSGKKFKVTGKVDGTCCLVKDGVFHKRRDIKINGKGKRKKPMKVPEAWFETSPADKYGHRIGFMPIEKEDKWFRDVLDDPNHPTSIRTLISVDGKLSINMVPLKELDNQTVELVGPKIQGNLHSLPVHCVIPHGMFELTDYPEDFNLDGLKSWFESDDMASLFEGIVVHFEDGSLFKIHRHHLDMVWSRPVTLMSDNTEPKVEAEMGTEVMVASRDSHIEDTVMTDATSTTAVVATR
jgi:hypothetical protein